MFFFLQLFSLTSHLLICFLCLFVQFPNFYIYILISHSLFCLWDTCSWMLQQMQMSTHTTIFFQDSARIQGVSTPNNEGRGKQWINTSTSLPLSRMVLGQALHDFLQVLQQDAVSAVQSNNLVINTSVLCFLPLPVSYSHFLTMFPGIESQKIYACPKPYLKNTLVQGEVMQAKTEVLLKF